MLRQQELSAVRSGSETVEWQRPHCDLVANEVAELPTEDDSKVKS